MNRSIAGGNDIACPTFQSENCIRILIRADQLDLNYDIYNENDMKHQLEYIAATSAFADADLAYTNCRVLNPGVVGVVTCIKLSVARTTAQQAVSGANGVVTADLMVRSPFYTRKVYTDPSGIVYPFCNAFPVLSGICHDVTF